jgi:hypothetical protein
MLSVYEKNSIIDKIPNEGGHTTKLGKTYSDDEIDAIVDSFFTGKKPPSKGQLCIAEILLGAPGSGKSYDAFTRYDGLSAEDKAAVIYVSYDETGAIFAIPDYINDLKDCVPDYVGEHTPVDAATKIARQEMWDNYRDPSQLIRSRILKRALAEGYNLMIDTTSSSTGSAKLAKTLGDLGYDQIACTGTYAPFGIGVERCIDGRVRPTSDLEVVTKRVGDPEAPSGALNMLPAMIKATGDFEYQYNLDNEHEPRVAFRVENGVVTYCDADVVRDMYCAAQGDVAGIHAFIAQHPESFEDFNIEYVEQSYGGFLAVLETVLKNAPAPVIAPNGPSHF